jgi:isoquinoline 1-oxidoreductase subunit beta
MAPAAVSPRDANAAPQSGGISRRRFIGYLIAAPTLVAAADLSAAKKADASVPTVQPVDFYDLTDLLTDAAMATASFITVTINSNGSASFALPRAEVGQGITTSIAMIIADELDLPLSQIDMTLADATPELLFNQLTGGSNSIHALYDQVRVAAATARGQLARTAAKQLQTPLPHLKLKDGVITAPNGKATTYAALARKAAVSRNRKVRAELKPLSAQGIVGTPTPRIDALDAVTGRKQFAMDLEVPNALPTMVCRPPTINGNALAVTNMAQVEAMPGVTDVTIIPHTQFVAGGVAVRAATFGQCIDAVRALDVQWSAGTAGTKSDADVLQDLINAELTMTPALGQAIDQRFTFYFRPGDPLETNCAIADVRSDSAEIWSAMKSPIYFQETVATEVLGLPITSVTAHVTQAGGSFGRHLFADAAFEAAAISKAMGKPVKLMWHRSDNFRQGRVHPMSTSRVRATYLDNNVLAFDQRHTSVATDFTHGLGELLSATFGDLPEGDFLGYAQSIFTLTANVPYNFGLVTQLLNEVYQPPSSTFNTSSVRNIYSPEVTVPREILVDQLAKTMGQDALKFRQSFIRDPRMLAVLNAAAQAANWGQSLPAGFAQGIGIHHEYKGYAACIVTIDCTPQTVNRVVQNGYTGPRVTSAVFAVDVGLPINPLGLQAQMMGGIMDGIAQALTYSLHLKDGYFLEASWDNAYYTREWNTPFDVEVIVMPPNQSEPGGAGELGVAASMAATANAYARATGTMPASFPINHNLPLGFTPYPTVPPIPQSPTDGLSNTF